MTCGNCGRAIHEGRPACLYCGWSASAFASSAEGGLLTPPETPPRTFRSGGSLVRFGAWALLCSGGAWIAVDRRILWPWLPAAFAVLGPLAFLAYVARCLRVSVTVEPAFGIRLSSGAALAWDDVEDVAIRGLRLHPDYWLFHQLLDLLRGVPVVIGTGLLSILTILLRMVLGILLLASAVVSGLLLPIFVLLSPFQPRVELRLKNGQRLVWRDLNADLDFVRAVEEGLRSRR